MTEDSRSRVLVVEKLVKKQMDANAKRPQGEVPDIFRKIEGGERNAEGEVGEGGLGRQFEGSRREE